MNPTIATQKAVRDNAGEVTNYLKDLGNWTVDMKAKELAKSIPEDELPVKRELDKDPKRKFLKSLSPDDPLIHLLRKQYIEQDGYDPLAEEDKEQPDKELTEEELVKRKAIKMRQKEVAEKKKQLGNDCLQKKQYDRAIQWYTDALALTPDNAVLWANRAQAYLYVGKNLEAKSDCDKALSLDSLYVKAKFRRAKACIALEDWAVARYDLQSVLNLDKKNVEAIGLLNKVEAKLQAESKPSPPPKVVGDQNRKRMEAEALAKYNEFHSKPNPHELNSPKDLLKLLEGSSEASANAKDSKSKASTSGQVPSSSSSKPKPKAQPHPMSEPILPTPSKSYDFDATSELKEVSVRRFPKVEQGGAGDATAATSSSRAQGRRIIQPISKSIEIRSKKPLLRIPIKMIEGGVLGKN